jgi:V8-like Glu-specific endopeptidase
VNTFALTKCKNFYKSKNLYSHLEQQCSDNGKWSGESRFECEPDCGMPNTKLSLRSVVHDGGTNHVNKAVEELSLPWHALIFDMNKDSQTLEFLCGATLIERHFVLTAGHCFEARGSLKSVKIVLSPVSKNFSVNLDHDHSEILEVSHHKVNAILNPTNLKILE